MSNTTSRAAIAQKIIPGSVRPSQSSGIAHQRVALGRDRVPEDDVVDQNLGGKREDEEDRDRGEDEAPP